MQEPSTFEMDREILLLARYTQERDINRIVSFWCILLQTTLRAFASVMQCERPLELYLHSLMSLTNYTLESVSQMSRTLEVALSCLEPNSMIVMGFVCWMLCKKNVCKTECLPLMWGATPSSRNSNWAFLYVPFVLAKSHSVMCLVCILLKSVVFSSCLNQFAFSLFPSSISLYHFMFFMFAVTFVLPPQPGFINSDNFLVRSFFFRRVLVL